jgi:aurora kinase
MNSNKCELNNVKNRFLPPPQSVKKGLESEPKIQDFEILKELGSGSFGRVFLARHNKTKVKYAIKAIDKTNKTNIEEKPYFRRELEVMYKIHHPNVVKLFGHFEDNKYCYFIMEYISKGNVYNLLTLDKKRQLSTKVIATIMKDVISATYFLHNMNPPIIHRDIKPENVLLNEGMVAKLTDFGWSNYIQEDKERKTVCGTPIYLAPEIIKEKGHDERVDIWCIGVLLFELITGSVPFQGNDIETLKSNILHLRITWPKEMNPDAKDLISKILKLDPNQRLPLEDMLQHPFFLKYFPDAPSCLILPDPNIIYKTFAVSKDDPETWDPVQKNVFYENITIGPIDNISGSNNKKEAKPKDKYTLLQEKYENLKNDYYAYKSGNQSINEIEELKRKIKEKNDKLEQLMKGNKIEEDDKDLKSKCNNLENENNDLRNQVMAFEQRIKEQQSQSIDSKLNEFRNSLVNYDKDYEYAFEDLKNHLNKETRQNLNEIIRTKDQEIEKYKEEEKARREKEKKKYTSLINKYDQTLSWVEKENQELKRKIKELEAKLPKK